MTKFCDTSLEFSNPSLIRFCSFKLKEITTVHLWKSYCNLTFLDHKFSIKVGYKVNALNIHKLKIIVRVYYMFQRLHDSLLCIIFWEVGGVK